MNQAQEVEAQRRGQTTKQHAAELQAVSISLVMWHQVIVVENSYPEHRGVDTHTQEEDADKTHHLDTDVVMLFFSRLDKNSEEGEDRVCAEEGALGPDDCC